MGITVMMMMMMMMMKGFQGVPNKMCLIYRFKGIVEVRRGSSHSSGSGVEWSVHQLDGNREVFLFHLILGSPRVSVEVASSNCHNTTTEWQESGWMY